MTQTFQCSVILCSCQGQISNRLSLSEIDQFLQRMMPGVSLVVADNLCQAGTLARFAPEGRAPLVVGACSELRHKSLFASSPHIVSIVNLIKESSAYSTAEATERVNLLLWAQLSRMGQSTGLRQDNLKLRFTRPQGKFSRRELFGLFRPHHQVIPYIDSARCLGKKSCRLCRDACPLQAITLVEGKPVIDQYLCQGCGGCIVACPQRAILYPTFSLEQLDKEMAGLLLPESRLLEPRIIALVCQNCPVALDKNEASRPTYPSNVLPLSLPCLAMASSWLLLRAFDLGVQGVVVTSVKGKCPSGFGSTRWHEPVRFVQALLSCWGIEPQRLKALERAKLDELEPELAKFAQEVASLPPTPLKLCQPTNIPAEGLLLPALIKGTMEKLTLSAAGTISAGSVPFGSVELDAAHCTGCGLCAIDCPTKALTLLSTEADSYQLLFCHDLCPGCNACQQACPEKCLRVEALLQLDRLGKPPTLLFQDKVVYCRQCGSSIGPQAMINRLRTKVPEIGSALPSQFELCPVCQLKAKLSSSIGAVQI